jgi:signal peptidase II
MKVGVMRMKGVLFLGIAAAVVLLDQLSKRWIVSRLEPGGSISVIDGLLDIVHARNTGVAFGILSGADMPFRTGFFLLVSLVAMGIILMFLRSLPPERTGWVAGLGLVFGGAWGNLIDRVRFGEVIDFLDVHVGAFHWPAFNVADSAVTVGALYLLLRIIRKT